MEPTLRAQHKSERSRRGGPALPCPKELEEFVRRYNSLLTRLCARWARGNRDDAQDLLAEAYLRAVSAADHGRLAADNPVAWVSSIIANLARDQQRARNRRASATGDGHLEAVHDPKCGSDALLATRELLSQTLVQVRALGRLQRAALLARGAGESYEAIAARLDTSPTNARKLVQTARRNLRGRVAALEPS